MNVLFSLIQFLLNDLAHESSCADRDGRFIDDGHVFGERFSDFAGGGHDKIDIAGAIIIGRGGNGNKTNFAHREGI